MGCLRAPGTHFVVGACFESLHHALGERATRIEPIREQGDSLRLDQERGCVHVALTWPTQSSNRLWYCGFVSKRWDGKAQAKRRTLDTGDAEPGVNQVIRVNYRLSYPS